MAKRSKADRQSKRLTKDARRVETRLVSLAATHDSTPFRQGVERFLASRIVYRFDEDLTNSLMETDLKVMPPRSTLQHLPHDTFVVAFGEPVRIWDDEDERTRKFDGVLLTGVEPIKVVAGRSVFATSGLNSPSTDTVRGTYFGSFEDDGTPQLATASLPLNFDQPLDTFYDLFDEPDLFSVIENREPTPRGHHEGDVVQTSMRKPLGRLLWQLLLYLASPEPDFAPAASTQTPALSDSTRQASKPQIFDVGWKVGVALREGQRAASTDLGGSVRAHVRRGHWHTYIYGGRNGAERTRRLKWVNPLIVNANSGKVGGTVFAEGDEVATPLTLEELGAQYRMADQDVVPTRSTEDDQANPDIRGRGARAHATLQNGLAAAVVEKGLTPLSPSADDPQYDISWVRSDGTIMVVEVKSLGATTEVSQLRLGVGQVIQYRWNLTALYGADVEAVLFVERKPSDSDWIDLCRDEGISLAWPGTIQSLFEVKDESA